MPLRNNTQDWGSVAKTLHWLMAALILCMFVLGWVAVNYPMSPTKLRLFTWHKTLGITLLVLVLLRLAWRLVNPIPSLPSGMRPWERTLARASHALLYVAMLATPLSGWVIHSAANFPLKLYGLFLLPAIAPADKALQTKAELTHLILFWIFAASLFLHIGAALWHHLVLRDDTLTRMLPTRKKSIARPGV